MKAKFKGMLMEKSSKKLMTHENVPSIVLVKKGKKAMKFQLVQYNDDDGVPEVLGDIHDDTAIMVLNLWMDNLSNHASPDIGPLEHAATGEFLPEWEEEIAMGLRSAHKDPIAEKVDSTERRRNDRLAAKMKKMGLAALAEKKENAVALSDEDKERWDEQGVWFMWPDDVLRKAEVKKVQKDADGEDIVKDGKKVVDVSALTEEDSNVAKHLFFIAMAEAREDVWAKYQRKIVMQAQLCLGAPKGNDIENADVERAKVAQGLSEGDDKRNDVSV
jgi:hypothetical protein